MSDALQTQRLLLRRPRAADAEAILARYSGDPEVTRYLGWRRHRSLADTRAFLAFSDASWERWRAGPFLILAREDGELLGSTGLAFETDERAMTGYALARDAWGRGIATEALRAIVTLAPELGLETLLAYCHVAHAASARVLEKCAFRRTAVVRGVCRFPNLDDPEADTARYELEL